MDKPANWPPEIPYIDSTIRHVSVSELRRFNGTYLKSLTHAVVIHGVQEEPVAVLLPFDVFLKFQEARNG